MVLDGGLSMRQLARTLFFSMLYFCMAGGYAAEPPLLRFHGICDGSAAVELNNGQLLVGYDESNAWYRFNLTGGHYLEEIDYGAQFGFDAKSELDVEAAAVMAADIWWLGSHGLDGDGKIAPARRSLFRTTLDAPTTVVGDRVDLLERWQNDLFSKKALARAPDKGGVNFEGLAAGKNGELMIGVRSPLSNGKNGRALVIEWRPGSISAKVHRLDLGDRGIRAMARHRDGYLLVAGGARSRGVSALYYWSPDSPAIELPIVDSRLRPEAIVQTAGGYLILSDDGRVKRGDKRAKKGKRSCDKIRRKHPAASRHPNVYFTAQALSAGIIDATLKTVMR